MKRDKNIFLSIVFFILSNLGLIFLCLVIINFDLLPFLKFIGIFSFLCLLFLAFLYGYKFGIFDFLKDDRI